MRTLINHKGFGGFTGYRRFRRPLPLVARSALVARWMSQHLPLAKFNIHERPSFLTYVIEAVAARLYYKAQAQEMHRAGMQGGTGPPGEIQTNTNHFRLF